MNGRKAGGERQAWGSGQQGGSGTVTPSPEVLEELHTLSHELAAASGLEAVARAVAPRVGRLLKVEVVSLMIPDESGRRLVLRGGLGWDSSQVGRYSVPVETSREGHVFRTGEPVQQREVPRGEPFPCPGELAALGVRSSLTVPLKAGGQVLGTLCAHTRRDRVFDPAAVRLLCLVGNLTALALDRERRLREAIEAAREAETLRRSGAAVLEALEEGEVIDRILDALAEVVPYDSASVQLLREGHLEIVGGRGWEDPGRVLGLRFPVPGDNPNTQVIRSRQPLILEDAPAAHTPFREPPHDHIRSWLGVPLIARGQVLGMLTLDSTEPGHFSREDARLAKAFADHVAVTLLNARLLEETGRRARHLETLMVAVRGLLAGLDLSETLSRILEAAGEALEADRAAVYLLDSERGGLTCPARRGLSAEYVQRLCERYAAVPGSRVLERADPMFVADAQSDPRLGDMRAAVRREGFHSYLVLPLLVEGKPLGALVVYWDRVLSPEAGMLQLGQALADHAAVALARARQHEAVREAEARYRELFDRVPVGLYRTTPEGRILAANRALVEMLGYPDLDSLLNTSAEALYVDQGMRAEWRRRMGAEGVVLDFEEQLRRYDGRVIWVRDSARAVRDEAGRVLYYEGSLEDITARKESEEALRRSHRRLEGALEELKETQAQLIQQERLAAIGQLAAGIAHDFNNLLGAVVLYADLLREEPGLSEKGRERLEIIQKQVRRAASLTEQILDFSRRSLLRPQPLDLGELVEETVRMLERTLGEQVQLEVVVGEGAWPVEADPARLQQALTNLALNARDAMPEGGRLTIRLERLVVREGETPPFRDMPAGAWACLTVADTGAGIPPDVLPRIFEPFFTTKPPGQGTGLGLAQVYGIVKQHGGYIDVQTRVGEGTVFLIYLPLRRVEGEAGGLIRHEEVAPGQGETVLVVEDDPAVRQALVEVLTAHNYRVLAASGGEEALALVAQDPGGVDLVVTDLVMPGMSGLALCRELRARAPALPLVALTGYPPGTRTQDLLESMGVCLAQKPVTPAEVVRVIQEALRAAGSGGRGRAREETT